MAEKKKHTAIEIPVKIDEKALKNFSKVLVGVTSELKKINTEFSKNFGQTSQQSRNMNASSKSTDRYRSSVESLNSAIKDNTKTGKEQSKSLFDINNALNGAINPVKQMQSGFHGLTSKVERFLPYALGLHFGLQNVVSEAHRANQETLDWAKSLASMSTPTGNAMGAVSKMTEVFGYSAGSLETVKANMLSLNDQGISIATKGFGELTRFVTNMSLATGIGAETFSSFSGIMIRNWGQSISATEEMTSSVIAMQKAFGSTSSEINASMKLVGDSMEKLAMYFTDGEKSAKSLTKGISMTVGVMNKLGVSSQKATEFVGGLLDPEKMSENVMLMGKLGVSYQQYMDMLSNSNSKDLIFDTILQKLPEVSQQLQAIQNPMARLNFSKSLGLPLEIAQKMANATTGQISQLMKDYKQAAVADKAAQEKQKQMKAESQKFDDTLHLMKRNALQPMMEWINKNIGIFWKAAGMVFKLFRDYTTGLTKVFDAIKVSFLPAFDVLSSGGSFGDFLVKLTDGFINLAAIAFNKLVSFLVDSGPAIAKSMATAWGKMMMEHPIITSLITIAAGMKLYTGVVGGIKDFVKAFKGERGSSPLNPMFVKNASISDIVSGGGSGILGKAKNFLGFGGKAKVGGDLVAKGGMSMLSMGAVPTSWGAGASAGGAAAGGGIGALAAPLILLAGAIAGGIGGYRTANRTMRKDDYGVLGESGSKELGKFDKFYESDKGKDKLANMKYGEEWGTLLKFEKDRVKKNTLAEVSGSDKAKATMIGVGTLGIVPLIDKVFNTQITKGIAEFTDKHKEILATGPLNTVFYYIGNKITEWAGSFNDSILNAKEFTSTQQEAINTLEEKMKKGKKLNSEEMAQYTKLLNLRLEGVTFELQKNETLKDIAKNNKFGGMLATFLKWIGVVDDAEYSLNKWSLSIRKWGVQLSNWIDDMGLGIKIFMNDNALTKGDSKQYANFLKSLSEVKIEDSVKSSSKLMELKGQLAGISDRYKEDAEKAYSAKVKNAFNMNVIHNAWNANEAGLKEKQKIDAENQAKQNAALKMIEKHTGAGAGYTKKIAEKDDRKQQKSDWIGAFLGYSTAVKIGVGGE